MVHRLARAGLPVVLLLCLGIAPTASYAQQQPSIAFAESTCIGGRAATVYGQGFVPGDTVSLELVPPVPRRLPVPPSLPTESIPQATVTVGPDGRFVARVNFVSPVTGGAFHGSPPGETEYYALQAVPFSFGERSEETISRAPKAVCAAAPEVSTPIAAVATPGGLPATGAGPRTAAESAGAALVGAGIVFTICLGLLGLARRVDARR